MSYILRLIAAIILISGILVGLTKYNENKNRLSVVISTQKILFDTVDKYKHKINKLESDLEKIRRKIEGIIRI